MVDAWIPKDYWRPLVVQVWPTAYEFHEIVRDRYVVVECKGAATLAACEVAKATVDETEGEYDMIIDTLQHLTLKTYSFGRTGPLLSWGEVMLDVAVNIEAAKEQVLEAPHAQSARTRRPSTVSMGRGKGRQSHTDGESNRSRVWLPNFGGPECGNLRVCAQ